MTEDKAYLCDKGSHEFFQKYINDVLSKEAILEFKPYWSDSISKEAGYIQETDVNGHGIHLC